MLPKRPAFPDRTRKKGARGRARKRHRTAKRPATVVDRLAVSFESALADQVRRAADIETDGNVSAWLASAARERLRLAAMQRALDDFEARGGKLTQAELDEADRLWPRV